MRQLLYFFFFICIPIIVFAGELDNRGLIALERGDDTVFLSWRMLDEPAQFSLLRNGERINLPNDGKVTNWIDRDVKLDETYVYQLQVNGKTVDESSVKIAVDEKPYISIKLDGDYDVKKLGIGDLDGDGELEYVIQQPNFNTDPYQKPGYWKKSETTYKIEAYEKDGTLMWRYDMGWAIEAGTWYAPWIVYDVDQDGKAEVYCKAGEGDPRNEKGLVESGVEYLVKLDGETGEKVAKTDWISRDGFRDYNYYCRNFLTVAYLDGKKPSLVMQRGTYRLIKQQAVDRNFKTLWTWEADESKPKYRGQSAHGLYPVDVDEDGRDELVIGAAVIDDDGKELWTLGMGHPDVCYVADIDPDNDGLEIFYGFETRQDTDGICVVDAKSGKKLWAHKKPTHHIHGQGMAGDILSEYPGMEVYSGERDYDERWLYSAKGELISFIEKGSLTPRPVWWDDDPQKEVVMSGAVRDWGKDAMQRVEGKLVLIVDCLGDYREEVITGLKGEIRIYSTTIPSSISKPCLLTDRQYRLGIASQTMGYYYPAQLGLSPQ